MGFVASRPPRTYTFGTVASSEENKTWSELTRNLIGGNNTTIYLLKIHMVYANTLVVNTKDVPHHDPITGLTPPAPSGQRYVGNGWRGYYRNRRVLKLGVGAAGSEKVIFEFDSQMPIPPATNLNWGTIPFAGIRNPQASHIITTQNTSATSQAARYAATIPDYMYRHMKKNSEYAVGSNQSGIVPAFTGFLYIDDGSATLGTLEQTSGFMEHTTPCAEYESNFGPMPIKLSPTDRLVYQQWIDPTVYTGATTWIGTNPASSWQDNNNLTALYGFNPQTGGVRENFPNLEATLYYYTEYDV